MQDTFLESCGASDQVLLSGCCLVFKFNSRRALMHAKMSLAHGKRPVRSHCGMESEGYAMVTAASISAPAASAAL